MYKGKIKRNKLQNLIFNYFNIKKINKNKFVWKKSEKKTVKKKEKKLWIIVVIHGIINMSKK